MPIVAKSDEKPDVNIYPKLKPGLLLIPLNSDEFYIGESSDGVYVPLDPYLSIARGCDGLHSINDIALLIGIPRGMVVEFLEELRAHNYIELRTHLPIDPGLDELAKHYAERIAPEHQLFTWRDATDDGGVTEVASRENFSILIFGQNRLARALLANLQASGFSQTKIAPPITSAGARIQARDICGITTRPIDIGRKQIEFHKQIALDSQLTQSAERANNLVNLLISTTEASSDYIQRWLSEGVPHLQIASPSAYTLEIGPLVTPGAQACLNCVRLHRRDFLPPFITMATPIASAHYEVGGSRELTSASTSFAAGVVTPYICEFAARGSSSLVSHSLVIDLLEPLHRIRELHWNVHPECGCGSSNANV